jgi:hypothetical protein
MKCYEIKSNNILHVGGNPLLVAQIYLPFQENVKLLHNGSCDRRELPWF